MIKEHIKIAEENIRAVSGEIRGQQLGLSIVPDLPLLLLARIQTDMESLAFWAERDGLE